MIAGAPAPIFGLEVTYTIEAMCWNGVAVILKIYFLTLWKPYTNLELPAYGLLYTKTSKTTFKKNPIIMVYPSQINPKRYTLTPKSNTILFYSFTNFLIYFQ